MLDNKMMIKKLIVILFSFLTFLTGSGDILWWQVDDTATVDGQSIYSFVSSYGTEIIDGYDFYNVGARVRMTNPDGSTAIIPIAYPDFPGDRFEYAEFFNGGGANGAGFGTGYWSTQSVLHEVPEYNFELLNEAQFLVELGELSYDDVFDIVGWETIAVSDTKFGSELRGMIFPGGVSEPADFQWIPTRFHTVPEPSTFLLCLLGAALLMLRRKHHEKA